MFVIFSPPEIEKFLPPGFSDILFLAVTISMALTPLLAMLGKWSSDTFQIRETQSNPKLAVDEISELKNHIIIAGFGRVGQMLGDLLATRFFPLWPLIQICDVL